MHLILLYQNGTRVDAIPLAASRGRVRLVIPNCTDTIEFRLKSKRLISEDGGVAEIEAMISDGRADMAGLGSHFRHAAEAA
jgi:hypothetical protein